MIKLSLKDWKDIKVRADDIIKDLEIQLIHAKLMQQKADKELKLLDKIKTDTEFTDEEKNDNGN